MISLNCEPQIASAKIPMGTTLDELFNKYNPYGEKFIFWNDFMILRALIVNKIKYEPVEADMTYHDYYSKYRASEIRNMKAKIIDNKIRVNGMDIGFKRTLRIPNFKCDMHPDLGLFPIHKVGKRLVLPMYQREGLWMELGPLIDWRHSNMAIKVGCGDKNIINGEDWETNVGRLNGNYCTYPGQTYLDGAFIKKDRKQQIVGTLNDNSLRFEIYVPIENHLHVYIPSQKKFVSPFELISKSSLNDQDELIYIRQKECHDHNVNTLTTTLSDLGMRDGDMLMYKTHATVEGNITVTTLLGKKTIVPFNRLMTVMYLKNYLEEELGIPNDQQRLIYAGKQMDEQKLLSAYGVDNDHTVHLVLRLRGGDGHDHERFRNVRIEENGFIYNRVSCYHPNICFNTMGCYQFSVKLVNSAQYKKMPVTPITKATYASHNYPWLEEYNEDCVSTIFI
ncbi:MAG: hypothetical protein Hyperionvirus2_175 [Hyperionvirus sp.]|uniref:Ubiquitin-like domain-containing protein n=1 Tax=Hyperionvirus sp. TaxID=2487770 RepID=A0A3G5A6D8_9VIRU|nr:MAG: hypothetical protein Hyperionvirus2_175 [Hyperionvirus sp.]